MKEFKLQNYSKFELLFGEYRWGRRLSKAFWVKLEEEGYSWVKFDKEDFKKMKFQDHVTFSIEDYTDIKLPFSNALNEKIRTFLKR